jgi:hypothetical protein
MIGWFRCFGPVALYYGSCTQHSNTTLTPWPGSSREKEEGAQSHYPLQGHAPIRLHLLRVLFLPNRSTLRTKSLVHGPLGETLKIQAIARAPVRQPVDGSIITTTQASGSHSDSFSPTLPQRNVLLQQYT